MSSTQITPKQSLLSTIYKQSWHPVASVRNSRARGSMRHREPNSQTWRLQRTNNFRHGSDMTYQRLRGVKEKESKTTTIRHAHRSPNNDKRLVPKATSITIFTTSTSDPNLQAMNSHATSLSAWKRQLKTCIDSNSREKSCHVTNDRGKTLKERLSSARRQENSPHETSSAKCYKILNYQNATLSSICVLGKDPPIRPRSSYSSRSRSVSSSTCTYNAIDKTGNVITKTSLEADAFESDQQSISSDIEADFEEDVEEESEHLINGEHEDDVFLDNDPLIKPMSFQDNDMPNLEMINLNFPEDENNTGSDMESDLSDLEKFSDGEEENPDLEAKKENDKCYIEKYKNLYKNENISNTIDMSQDEESNNTMDCEEDERTRPMYTFAPVFPKNLKKYNLKELACLPYDVSWKSIVKITDLTENRTGSKKNCVAKQRSARSTKIMEERIRMESLVDRLLEMEKLQINTKKAELIARYHSAHVRATAKLKAQSSKPATIATPAINDTKTDDVTTETGTSSRTSTRRRSSVPISSARLAWANELTKGDQTILKKAHKSGDFTLLINDWSSKNRQYSKANNDKGRRSSEYWRILKRARSRLLHPRFYEYHWSERSKDDRGRTTTYWYNRTRSCPTCRDKWRKMNQAELERRKRPSTASLSCPSTPRSQFVNERSFFRPATQNTTRLSGSAAFLPQTTSSSNNRNFKSMISYTTTCVELNNASKATKPISSAVIQESKEELKQNGQKASFITSSFKISSASISRRPWS